MAGTEAEREAIRDHLAERSPAADVRFPRALDLEADVLVAMHRELAGVAGQLAGHYSAFNWRGRLRGQRVLPVGELCRLATDPRREARAAVLAGLDVLAAALGRRLERSTPEGDAAILRERAERLVEASRAFEAAVAEHGGLFKHERGRT